MLKNKLSIFKILSLSKDFVVTDFIEQEGDLNDWKS